MNVSVSPYEAKVILSFLQDTTYVQMPKKHHAILARFGADVKLLTINTDRLKHTLPTIRAVHNVFQNMSERNLRYGAIERWMRILVLPAVAKYLFRVLPAKRRYEGQLRQVAAILNRLSGGDK